MCLGQALAAIANARSLRVHQEHSYARINDGCRQRDWLQIPTRVSQLFQLRLDIPADLQRSQNVRHMQTWKRLC